MIFVNFVSRFDVTPWMLKHHRAGLSYSDTIAPIFIFVVGIGFRLSFTRRAARTGPWAARWAAVKRYVLITLLGFLIYPGYFWDALTDIGLAGLLALGVIDRSTGLRTVAAFAFLGAYQAIYSLTGYGQWVATYSLNGGPLGPLSWAFILLMGTVCYDILASHDTPRIATGCLLWGAGLSLAGWLLKAEWPGIKEAWPFSQYGMSAPYPFFATGLAFLTFLGFHCLCDVARRQLPHLTVLGENPLVLYLTQAALIAASALILKNDAPLSLAALGFACTYGACYALAKWLHAHRVIVKI